MKHFQLLLIAVITIVISYGQNNNPYAVFGHNSTVEYKSSQPGELLYIKNQDTGSRVKALSLNAGKRELLLLGENDEVIQKLEVEPQQFLRWLSTDPLASKYPNESPYLFCGGSPIMYIDPDGREKIVVTGGEYTASDRYKYNFVEPAITQLNAYKKVAGKEKVTWAVMNKGYSADDIKKFQSIAKDKGVTFVLLNTDKELIRYVNRQVSTPAGVPEKELPDITKLSTGRENDPITNMTIFGHGFVGSMEFGYHQSNPENLSVGTDDIGLLNAGAFNNATIDLFTCNAGTPTDGTTNVWSSFAGQLATQTNTKVTGYLGKTDYAKMNEGQGIGDKINRRMNGFNTNGSVNLPTGGTQNGTSKPSVRYSFDQTQTKP